MTNTSDKKTIAIDCPAIYGDVRETLLAALESKHANLKSRLADDSTKGYKAHIDKWFKRISRARDWLALQPMASDKAVCPKCGQYPC